MIAFGKWCLWRPSALGERPDVAFVPPLDRRRMTTLERAALHVAHDVRPDCSLPVVFASRHGEIGVTEKLMRRFHDEGEMSPAGFSSSVHNAAPGAWSVLTGNHESYTAIAGRARSFECGLLEAMALGRAALFVYAEEPTPEAYLPDYPDPVAPVAFAVIVGAGETTAAMNPRRADFPPAGPDDLVRFLRGEDETFRSSWYELTRGRMCP